MLQSVFVLLVELDEQMCPFGGRCVDPGLDGGGVCPFMANIRLEEGTGLTPEVECRYWEEGEDEWDE